MSFIFSVVLGGVASFVLDPVVGVCVPVVIALPVLMFAPVLASRVLEITSPLPS
ncbi:MAG: hypothetical protein LBD11_06775 [Candidatus Peribacteria bacterium]|nr:hypothetical protein [Candidatus Peribacteria bacterium]